MWRSRPLWVTATAGTFGQGVSTFRSSVDVVALSVVVLDTQQRFVSGLTAHDFLIYEDGIQQDLSFFSPGQVPLDLAILLDTSASMLQKLGTAQQAALGFVATLRPEDRLLVVDIKDRSNVLAPLSHDTQAASRAILSTSPSGGTSLYNALYLTLKEMAKQRIGSPASRRQALVVVSDGWDTSSLVAFEDVMEEARTTGIAIYTIMLRPTAVQGRGGSVESRLAQSEYAMRAFATETGGRSFFPDRIDDLAGVYGRIADELGNQYALGYTSSNSQRNGAYRRIMVRVVARGDTRVRTRAGYLAPRG